MGGSMSGPKIFSQLEPRKLVKLWMAAALLTVAVLLLTLHDFLAKGPHPGLFVLPESYSFLPLILVWFPIPLLMSYWAWKITTVSRSFLESQSPAQRLAGQRQSDLLWAGTIASVLLWILNFPLWVLTLALLLGALGIVDIAIG
jgi:hypothetical protein